MAYLVLKLIVLFNFLYMYIWVHPSKLNNTLSKFVYGDLNQIYKTVSIINKNNIHENNGSMADSYF